jgi:hypothetical protein
MPPKKYPLTNSKSGQARERKKAEQKQKLKDTAAKVASTAKKALETVIIPGNDKEPTPPKTTASQPKNNTNNATIPTPQPTTTALNFDSFGGLKLTTFTPDSYLANNLFENSSPLPETNQQDADKICESVEKKKQTLRVVNANLELNSELLKIGAKNEKMLQSGIDYGTAKINTEIKLTQFENAKQQHQIALTKLAQTNEKLEHENVTLEGLKQETDQRRLFWQEKHALGESRIKQVQLAKYQLDAKIGAIDTESEVVE